jgi:pimeloyl-ACP methyl ester carboxylesterase
VSTLDLGNRANLYYERLDGDSSRPCLVFLHDALGCAAMWGDFPSALCEHSACPGLVYDRLGYGRSSPLTAARTPRYLHDYALGEFPRVRQTLIGDQAFVLIGHSDGASISLMVGAQRPALLKGIVSEAAHVFVEPETLAGIRQANAAYDAGKLSGLSAYHGEKTHGLFKAWSDTWLAEDFRLWNMEHLLPSIECPILVIQGEDDQYGTERQVQAIVRQSPRCCAPLMLPGCGHVPHKEAAEAVLAAIAEFVEAIV